MAHAREVEILQENAERNAQYFDDEMGKLDAWADDKRNSLRLSLKGWDDQIKELKREARAARSLPDKLAVQKKIRDLEKKRDTAWHDYDQIAREIEKQKDRLIDNIEKKLAESVSRDTVFTIRWRLR